MGDNFRSGRRMRQEEETIHWEENKKKQKIKCRTRQKERKNKQTFKNRWDYWTTGRRIHNDILEGKKKQNNNKPRGGKIMTSDTLTQNRHIHTHTHPHIDVHTHTHLQWHFFLVPQNQSFGSAIFLWALWRERGVGSGGHVERNRDKVASVFGYCRMREIKKEKINQKKKKRITNKQKAKQKRILCE